ncbi:MAG: hypothetical protein M3Y26_03785 [Actinomycetota bacterium]|nr:hypothetical protein [Actinomycetota bacterium]
MTATVDIAITPSSHRELRRAVRGEVRFDLGSGATYAVDSSNYREVPGAVVAPLSIDDAVAVLTAGVTGDAT